METGYRSWAPRILEHRPADRRSVGITGKVISVMPAVVLPSIAAAYRVLFNNDVTTI
jgi:hypothetical protein